MPDVSARDMKRVIEDSPELQQMMRTDPVAGLEEAEARAKEQYKPSGDPFLYRTVVVVLSAVVLVVTAGTLVLAFYQVAVPEVFVALGSAALGALAGLLAPSPREVTG
jgi:hypothetical protein